MLSLCGIKHRSYMLQVVRLCVSSSNGWTSTFDMGIRYLHLLMLFALMLTQPTSFMERRYI